MVSNANVQKLLHIRKEMTDLQNVYNGLMIAKRQIVIGQNMTAVGFKVMQLTEDWVKKEMKMLHVDREKIMDLI